MRWAEVAIKVATGEQIEIASVSDFQNGEILLKLTHALIKKPPPKINTKTTNKLSVVGNLQNVLDYITSDDVRITCSATGSFFIVYFGWVEEILIIKLNL